MFVGGILLSTWRGNSEFPNNLKLIRQENNNNLRTLNDLPKNDSLL